MNNFNRKIGIKLKPCQNRTEIVKVAYLHGHLNLIPDETSKLKLSNHVTESTAQKRLKNF